MTQKKFWDDRIIDWESRSYGGEDARPFLIETVASVFRGHIPRRQQYGLKFALEKKPACVLEVGCGSGLLTEKLLDGGVGTVIGVDISEQAISTATRRLQRYVRENRLRLIAAAVGDLDFSELKDVDCVIGLGLTPYLKDDELACLFEFIAGENRGFLLDYHDRRFGFKNLLHAVYRRLAPFPYYKVYSGSELVALARKHGVTARTETIGGNNYVFYPPGRARDSVRGKGETA